LCGEGLGEAHCEARRGSTSPRRRTFWMALHDVGKFSAPFSAQIEDLWLPEMGERVRVLL